MPKQYDSITQLMRQQRAENRAEADSESDNWESEEESEVEKSQEDTIMTNRATGHRQTLTKLL